MIRGTGRLCRLILQVLLTVLSIDCSQYYSLHSSASPLPFPFTKKRLDLLEQWLSSELAF